MHFRKIFFFACLLLLTFLGFQLYPILRPVLAHPFNNGQPSCTSIVPAAGNYFEDDITSLAITATDDLGISSMTVSLSINGGSIVTLPTPTVTVTSTTQTQTYVWAPTAGTYNLSVSATNNAGNTQSLCNATYVINPTIDAWIQVTGDVHSNTRINVPGGP